MIYTDGAERQNCIMKLHRLAGSDGRKYRAGSSLDPHVREVYGGENQRRKKNVDKRVKEYSCEQAVNRLYVKESFLVFCCVSLCG